MRINLDVISSTSTYMKEHLPDFSHGDVVSASFQSAGRGQRGNCWESARGQNALFSILLRPYAVQPAEGFVLNHIVALAMLDVLNAAMSCHRVMIKWPNDIYVDDRKLSGILIESTMSSNRFESAVVGIGLNVNQERFVSDAPNPVSMFQLTGKRYSADKLTEDITERVIARYNQYAQGENLYDEYMGNLYRLLEWHDFVDNANGHRFTGRITDVRPDGLLVVETKNNSEIRCFEFKSIKYII